MKKSIIIFLIYSFFINQSNAQRITINRIESRLITNEGVEFIGQLIDVNNDLYLFQNWNNQGVLYLEDMKYHLSNMNFNITSNKFDSRISRVKNFAFNNSEIDSVIINNHLFKKAGNIFCEVLYENEGFQFLKKYDIKYKEGVQNRLDGTFGKKKMLLMDNYLVKNNKDYKKIELNKKDILNLFDGDKETLEKFVSKEDLSYKKEEDIVKIFDFMLVNSNIVFQ